MNKSLSEYFIEQDLIIANELAEIVSDRGFLSAEAKFKIIDVISIFESERAINICLAVANALDRNEMTHDALEYCTQLHRIVLEQDKEELVGDIFLAQAKFHQRLGNKLSQDAYALYAAQIFIDNDRHSMVKSALDLAPN